MYLVYCSDCDRYARLVPIGQRIRFNAALNIDTGVFRPVSREHVLDEAQSEPERIWCPTCGEPTGEVVELEDCPCEGTTPVTLGQYWWEVRYARARCTLCGREIQGSTVVEWSAV